MKLRKFFSFLLISLTLFCILSSCSNNSDVKILRLGHSLDVTHPVHKAMVHMAEQVEKESHGKLQIKIYPNQQLGSERELLELLQIGSLDMTKVSAAVLENFVPKTKVFSLPYLFRNDEHLWSVLRGDIGKQLLLSPQKYWMRGLTYYDAGKRSFYTKNTPIRKPSDLKGLKIRVQESAMAIKLVQNLGGSPTPISWGELYTALQQGIVDGAENNPPSFETSKHYEVCKYYSLDEHTAIPDVLLISTKTWKRLTPQEQKWLQEAADSSSVYEQKLWAQAEQKAMKTVKDAGVKIIHPDKQPFIEKTQPIYDEIKQNDPKFYKLVQKIKAVK